MVSGDLVLIASAGGMATVARERGQLSALVDMSQMTISEMTATGGGRAESHQHRLHWLAEQVLDWRSWPLAGTSTWAEPRW